MIVSSCDVTAAGGAKRMLREWAAAHPDTGFFAEQRRAGNHEARLGLS
jgi:hypothetical protein